MPSWPSTLPQSFLISGFSLRKMPQSKRINTDTGPGQTRRRFTAAPEIVRGQMIMTLDQWKDVRTFYDTTLAGGSLTFDWVHPITGAAAVFQFMVSDEQDLAIIESTSHEKFRVTLALEIKP